MQERQGIPPSVWKKKAERLLEERVWVSPAVQAALGQEQPCHQPSKLLAPSSGVSQSHPIQGHCVGAVPVPSVSLQVCGSWKVALGSPRAPAWLSEEHQPGLFTKRQQGEANLQNLPWFLNRKRSN